VRNVETVDPKAFELKHVRPGTLSLCLGQNDDDDEIKLDPEYHNMEFLVTTGPGPCPELDNENIVFGTVLEGKKSVLYCFFYINVQLINIAVYLSTSNICILTSHKFCCSLLIC
jgi:hypothetical protein